MAKVKKKKVYQKSRLNAFGLTEREERFCREFIRDYNATLAMKRAGPSTNLNSIRVAGCMAMRKQVVRDRIDELQKEVFEYCKSSAELVVNELLGIAMFDPRRLATWGPGGLSLKPSKDLTLEEARMIESIEMRYDTQGNPIVKFKRCSRMEAHRILAMLHKDTDDVNDVRDKAQQLRRAFDAMGVNNVPPEPQKESEEQGGE